MYFTYWNYESWSRLVDWCFEYCQLQDSRVNKISPHAHRVFYSGCQVHLNLFDGLIYPLSMWNFSSLSFDGKARRKKKVREMIPQKFFCIAFIWHRWKFHICMNGAQIRAIIFLIYFLFLFYLWQIMFKIFFNISYFLSFFFYPHSLGVS